MSVDAIESPVEMERFAILGLQAASLLHEVNNRLHVVGGAIEIMLLQGESDKNCRDGCRKVVGVHREIQDLLGEVAHLAAGRLESYFRNEPVLIDDLVDDLRAKVRELAVVGSSGLRISCDRKKVVRALGDLVRNARQAGARHVHLDIRSGTGRVALRVVDDGHGIPESLRPGIFQAGFTHAKREGHGLGLFAARWLLQGMGGDLVLESTGARGTVFVATLPIAEPEP